MPLSEHEQRLLEQMERALYAEDPKFATSMNNPRPAIRDRRRVLIGGLAFLLGMGGLLAGVATRMVVIGVAGFLAMLFGIIVVIGAFKASATKPSDAAKPRAGRPSKQGRTRSPRPSTSGSLSERMEERWRKRRETGDF